MISVEKSSQSLASTKISPASFPPLKDLSILVVDDDEANQFLFKHLLVRKGAKVTLAENGADGLKHALENNFDIILMDIQMPVMDGYTAMEKLKTLLYPAPVIALTAHAHPEERVKISAAGFSAYAAKPVDAAALVSLIQNFVFAKNNFSEISTL